MPLLLLFDYSRDEEVQLAARRACDLIVAGIAAESLKGSRGGPWHRATIREQIVDARADVAWMVDYVFFGNVREPHSFEDSGSWLATNYRAPEPARRLALETEARGSYNLFTRGDNERPALDAAFHMSPYFCLASFQGGPPFKSCYMGSTNISNLHPWELTFAHPLKVLGVARSFEDLNDYTNLNTSLWQHGNVLFFRGDWLDYNHNLGRVFRKCAGRKTVECLHVQEGAREVLVSIVSFENCPVSVLEAIEAPVDLTPETWASEVLTRRAVFDDAENLLYETAEGVVMEFRKKVRLVNGVELPPARHPLFDSPYLKSQWESGIVSLEYGGLRHEIDFRTHGDEAGNGLRAEFYRTGPSDVTRVSARIDPQIEFHWHGQSPCEGLDPGDAFVAKWTGFLLPDQNGSHAVALTCGGAVQISLADKSVAGVGSLKLEIECRTGHQVPVKIQYNHAGGEGAFMETLWGPKGHKPHAVGLTYEAFSA